MRIGIASSGIGRVARGIETSLATLARALADRGCDVRLYRGAGRPGAPYERRIPSLGRFDRRTQRLLRALPRRGLWRIGLESAYGIEQTSFALHLLPHLRRDRIDVLQVKDPQIALLVQWAYRLHLHTTRVVLSHGTEERFEFLRHFDYLEHQAPWHLEEARHAGVWKPTWSAIPNFTDVDVFHPGRSPELRAQLGIPPDAFVVLTASAIKRKHKRVDFLLEEFASFLEMNRGFQAHLIVAGGREPDTDLIVSMGHQLLGDRVRFLVNFPHARMPELYRAADVFVLCSLKEMMSNALVEATASGLPCLVHDHPVLSWIIGDGGNLTDMTQPGRLSEALTQLLHGPESREKLGQRARHYCVHNFSRERVIDRYLEYYRFVAAQGRPAARLVAAL